MSSQKHFTEDEIEYLKANYLKLSNNQLANDLERSVSGVKQKLKQLKLCRNRYFVWNDERVTFLKANFSDNSSESVAQQLNCPVYTINDKARRLGLKKSAEYLEKLRTESIEQLKASGKGNRFQKGQTSWNKGKKGLHIAGCEKGHFKKGNLPANTAKIGDIAETQGGYLKIKIANPNKWQLLNQYVWEKHNKKPVPKGYVVRFIDGNIKNCVIENLELITKKENRRRNSIHSLYTPELKETIWTLAGLKRRINKMKEKKNG